MTRLDDRDGLGMIAPYPQVGCAAGSRLQLQVLRNQSVGSRCSAAGSGPRFVDRGPDQNVVLRRLGVFDRDIEIAILAQDPGIPKFELRFQLGACGVRLTSSS